MTCQEQDSQDGTSICKLPPELIVYIASYACTSSLVKLEQLSKNTHQLLTEADMICWRHHALSISSISTLSDKDNNNINNNNSSNSLTSFLALMKDCYLDTKYWIEVSTWKMAFKRLQAQQSNWSMNNSFPDTRFEIIGFNKVDPTQSVLPTPKLRSLTSSRILEIPYATQDSSYVWRARLDPSRDAKFVLTTWHTGGFKAVSVDPKDVGSVLWELPRWSVRPYAHLEYNNGVACWDGEAGIEVWKRWKLVLGEKGKDEPPNKRGQFVKTAILPDLAATRGFMLNDDLHLTICSSDGKSITYDLSQKTPQLLYSYDIPLGAAGHLEHDHDFAVYSLGHKGYTVFEKRSATMVGCIDFSKQTSTLFRTLDEARETNFFKVDSMERYPDLAATKGQETKNGHKKQLLTGPRKEFVTVKLESGCLEQRGSMNDQVIELQMPYQETFTQEEQVGKMQRTNAIPLNHDLWGAAMIRKLSDGATILVARSRGGRVMICSDLSGLFASLETGNEEEASNKVRECVAIIECGGRASRTEFYTGGWLAVHNGRAAWEIDDLVYMMALPTKRNTLPKSESSLWLIPSLYSDELPMPHMKIPISFMSLHDDAFMSTYLHPAYIFVSGQGHSRWETSVLKSVRIIRFSPNLGGRENVEEEEDNTHPLTNANKNLHRRWLLTSRRLAQDAEEEEEEEEEEWTDEEEQQQEQG